MMKKFSIVAVLLLLSVPVFATPMNWSETVNFVPKGVIGGFHVSNASLIQGSRDNNLNYSLYSGLYGNNKYDIFDGSFIVQTGVWEGVGLYDFNETKVDYISSFDDISSLNKNGLLEIALLSLTGEHYLDTNKYYASGVSFNGTATHGAVVPEPATIILLGSGILGLAWCVRNRKKV